MFCISGGVSSFFFFNSGNFKTVPKGMTSGLESLLKWSMYFANDFDPYAWTASFMMVSPFVMVCLPFSPTMR